jgi:hypothetical protein
MEAKHDIKIEHIPPSAKIETDKYFNKENTPETIGEHTIEAVEENKAAPRVNTPVVQASPVKSTPVIIDYRQKREKELDSILSEGLEETFLAMPPDKQKIFRAEGEATVKKINILLDATKVNINKIALLIKRWLMIIPGINRFFLDQEAKIKTDKVIKIKNKF